MFRSEFVPHDADAPLEHPALDVTLIENEGVIEIRQGGDRIVLPDSHANRVVVVLERWLTSNGD